MQLVSESRRNFVFEIPQVVQIELNKAKGLRLDECDHIRFGDYVTIKQNQLLFPKLRPGDDRPWIFNSIDDCEKWISKYEAEVRMNGFRPMERVDKTYVGIKSNSLKINPSDWEKIQSYFSSGDEFEESDFVIFESYLANNFLDRDGERFPLDVLKSFQKTIVGKSKITAHQWGPPGNGRFFKARIEEMTIEQALKLIGATSNKNMRKHLDKVKEVDNGIYFLVPTYYMLNVTEQEQNDVRQIRAGIVKDMSIGFRAPRKIQLAEDFTEFDYYDDVPDGKKILWVEYRNTKEYEAEALEGSHVFLGSQFGAQTYKSAGNGTTIAPEEMEKIFEKWYLARELEKEKARREDGEKKDAEEMEGTKSEDGENENDEKEAQKIDVEKYLQAFVLSSDIELDWIKDGGSVRDTVQKYFAEYIADWVEIEKIEDEATRAVCSELDRLICIECLRNAKYLEEHKLRWTVAYINSLEDDCFAYVENTKKKDDEGRTIPKTARHLPHHAKGEGARGTGGVVDLPHLRNALARVNQVRPVTETISKDALVEMSKDHLVAHAKKLGVGDYEEDVVRSVVENNRGGKMINFKLEDIGVDVPIDEEKWQDGLEQVRTAVSDALTTKFEATKAELQKKADETLETIKAEKTEIEEKISELETEKKTLEDEFAAVKAIYGEEYSLELLKQYKADAEAHRKFLIDEIIKDGVLLGFIPNEEAENERKIYENDPIARLKTIYDRYQKLLDAKYSKHTGDGVLPNNTDENRNVINQDKPQETAIHEERRRAAAQIM